MQPKWCNLRKVLNTCDLFEVWTVRFGQCTLFNDKTHEPFLGIKCSKICKMGSIWTLECLRFDQWPFALLLLWSSSCSADFCATLVFHLKLHKNVSWIKFNWTSLKIWAFVVFYEAKRCSSYLLRPHWQLVSFYGFLWSRALLQRLLALQPLDEHSSLGKEAVAKSPPSHQRGFQPCSPPQFWKQVLTQEFFPHSWKRNCVLSASGRTPSTTDNSSCLSSTFFRIVSSLLQLRRITSNMHCQYGLNTFFSA